MLNDNNIKDIESAILRKIVPMDAIGDDIAIGYCGVGRVTIASVSWIDKNGKLRIRQGVSNKRKGDKYNRQLGQIIALIDIIQKS